MAAPKTLSPQDVWIYGLDTEENDEASAFYDERINYPVDQANVKNVLALGVKLPILVRKATGDEAEEIPKGAYVVVDGRQRVRWAREANTILEKQGEPAIRLRYQVEEVSDDMVAVLGVATNSNRVEDSILVKAAKARRLKDRGYSVAEIAVHEGTTQQTIRNWLKLDALPTKIKKATEAGKITMTEAIKVGKAEDPNAALDEAIQARSDKASANANGSRGKPTRPKAPLKRWREAMALADDSPLSDDALHMLRWLGGRLSTDEAKDLIPGFGKALSAAKSKVTREDKDNEKRALQEAQSAGKDPEPEEEPEEETPTEEPEEETPAPAPKTNAKRKKKTNAKPSGKAKATAKKKVKSTHKNPSNKVQGDEPTDADLEEEEQARPDLSDLFDDDAPSDEDW